MICQSSEALLRLCGSCLIENAGLKSAISSGTSLPLMESRGWLILLRQRIHYSIQSHYVCAFLVQGQSPK